MPACLLNFQLLSQLNIGKCLLISSDRHCNDGFHPLIGQKLTISVFGIPPLLYSGDKAEGIIIDVIRILSYQHNFNYDIIKSHDWFTFGPNGTIGGSLGHVRTCTSSVFTVLPPYST